MSLQSPLVYTIPAETVRVAQAAFPKPSLPMRLCDHLGLIYSNPQFASLFSHTGQPALDPARLALILVLQFVEALPDRQAADAVRARIDWKYALALELEDPGFDASVLCEFRERLIDGQLELTLLDTLLSLLQQQGLLKARGKQRTDSTHVLAAIRSLNRLMCVGETLRLALNTLSNAAPDWLFSQLPAHWFDFYGPRFEQYRLPSEKTARNELALAIGADGVKLLELLYHKDAPSALRELSAVQLLRQVWIQHYHATSTQQPPRWREEADLPPAAQLIQSPYDVEARYSQKRDTEWVGYKAHLTESCDEDLPRVITHVTTTPATTQDDQVTATIHTALAAKGLLPGVHLLDAGYTSAQLLLTSRTDYQIDLLGKVARDPSWQAQAAVGYELSCFAIDWEREVVSCPQGKQSQSWRRREDKRGREVIEVRFGQKECGECEVRSECTRAKKGSRTVTFMEKEKYQAMQEARERQKTDEFKASYALRSGCESTISQAARVFELRRTGYIGLAKTHLQHVLIAVALTVVRVLAWKEKPSPAPKRISSLAALTLPG
jgi:transposase